MVFVLCWCCFYIGRTIIIIIWCIYLNIYGPFAIFLSCPFFFKHIWATHDKETFFYRLKHAYLYDKRVLFCICQGKTLQSCCIPSMKYEPCMKGYKKCRRIIQLIWTDKNFFIGVSCSWILVPVPLFTLKLQ
jgi:hypothetical protein